MDVVNFIQKIFEMILAIDSYQDIFDIIREIVKIA